MTGATPGAEVAGRMHRVPVVDPRVVSQLMSDAGFSLSEPITPALLLFAQSIAQRCAMVADGERADPSGRAGQAIRLHFGMPAGRRD